MNFFHKFKTYINNSQKPESPQKPQQGQPKPSSPPCPSLCSSAQKQKQVPKQEQKQQQQPLRKSRNSESYQIIMMDILEPYNLNLISTSSHKKSQELYQDLVYEVQEEQHQGIENIYLKDFIFVNKLSQARELTVEEWSEMVNQANLSLYPKKNIYFSILKGIKFQVRKKVWQLFANTVQMKKKTTKSYKQLTSPEPLSAPTVSQIDKDVPRSKSVTNYLPELRSILIAYCNLTKKQYTQGMNLIAGSLLTLLALENDEELGSFEIFQKEFEERVFWIFVGVMVWKNWDDIFDKDLLGLTKRLRVLEGLMAEHVPAVYQKLIDYQWDLTIFSQYYITIMLYNTPKDFSKIILDLFFLDGENALHSLIIRMMKLQQDKILSFSDQCQLMNYFKKEMINDCYLSVKRNRANAKKLQDFQMNFMKATKN